MSHASETTDNPPSRGYEGFKGTASQYSSNSTPAWQRPPGIDGGTPNVVMILIDDLGFSDLGAYGSEIATPHLDSLAASGYSFTNFHSSPVCSPARASLLTGMNPHRAGFGIVAHGDPGFPGVRLELDDAVPTLADKFRTAGYATFAVGKWHLTPEAKMNDGADRSSWPTQKGFDRYFGSLDGFTALYSPHRLVRDNSALTDAIPHDAYLTDVLGDEAVTMVRTLRANESRKPFFLYLAHQAVHGPIQAKPADMERVRGAYESGWDALRTERFERQLELGFFPAGTALPDSAVTPWDELDDDRRRLFARYMEVYAASVMALDESVGRLLAYLSGIGELDDTIIAIASDNGGTAEGGTDGTRSYFSHWVPDAPPLPDTWTRDVPNPFDEIGGPRSYIHYPAGWAQCSNTPFRKFKRSAFAGGIRVPLIVSWPHGLPRHASDDTGVRSQFTYMTDLHSTLLDLAGVTPPERWRGQEPPQVDGLSFRRVLENRAVPAVRTEQYVEHAGNRGMFLDGWKIVTDHRRGTAFDDSEWELYNIDSDPTETRNVRDEHPELTQGLVERWNAAAWWNTVYPLDDDGVLRARIPEWYQRFSEPVTLAAGLPTLERFRSSRLIGLRDWEIEARFDWQPGDHGVLVAHGDQGGGYSLAIDDRGEVELAYNAYGRMLRVSASLSDGGPQRVRVGARCADDLTWILTLALGESSCELPPVPQLVGMAPFTGISVGIDRGSPVDWERWERFGPAPYTGAGLEVQITPGAAVSGGKLMVHVDEITGRLAD